MQPPLGPPSAEPAHAVTACPNAAVTFKHRVGRESILLLMSSAMQEMMHLSQPHSKCVVDDFLCQLYVWKWQQPSSERSQHANLLGLDAQFNCRGVHCTLSLQTQSGPMRSRPHSSCMDGYGGSPATGKHKLNFCQINRYFSVLVYATYYFSLLMLHIIFPFLICLCYLLFFLFLFVYATY